MFEKFEQKKNKNHFRKDKGHLKVVNTHSINLNAKLCNWFER